MTRRVSLAELAEEDIQLRPAEAVAIVSEICRQYSSEQLHGIPSPGVIRLTREGTVVAEGPTTTDQFEVRRAAHLLSDLLPDFEAPRDYRASGGLRLVIARALGTLDLPPYATLQDFCGALGRFSVPDLATTVRSLFEAWERSQASRRPVASSATLTISDIRRARRATGLSLDDLAAVSDVPAARLRELEWGYLRHWSADDNGRHQLARYARAAGLDQEVVLSIAWPMLLAWPAGGDGVTGDASPHTAMALVPVSTQAITVVETIAPRRRPSRLPSIGLAVGSLALLTFATVGLYGGKSNRGQSAAPELVNSPNAGGTAPTPQSDPGTRSRAIEPVARSLTPSREADARVVPPPPAAGEAPSSLEANSGGVSRVVYTRPASSRRSSAAAPRPAAPAPRPTSPRPPRRSAARSQSILHKELFRIVIR
ncbi:MAG: hypothetical protein ABIQ52_21365 [Vicinamibacterales bacterium]